jgi:serine protease AprX
VNFNSSRKIKRAVSSAFLAAVIAAAFIGAHAASLSPDLTAKLQSLSPDASVGVVIVSFNGEGLRSSHLTLLRSLGINDGVTFQNLGMVGAVLNAGQVRALAGNDSVASIWTNERLQYHMNHARLMTGVDKLRSDAALTLRNGGMPVSGSGDFSVFVIDSGVDATHGDLPLGTKVIQNTQRVVSTNTGNTGITIGGVALNGLTPSLSIENVPNTDNVGHGTHVAATVGGTGLRSGGAYAGVAPGVKIVGSGGGVVIVVLDALAGWEYALANQDLYKIRVITNSYGPINPVDYNPGHPLVLASKAAYERNITVLWSASNDGAEDTVNAYAQAPFVIGVAAGSKDGMLAGFSSRGIPREQRLADNNPFNDNEAPTLTAPGTGRFFETNKARHGFTLDLVSARSAIGLTNLIAAGDDTSEISAGMLPFYTQMSGTSMATPFTAGIVALMLDADPTLNPDEIKQILIDTATRMPGYQEHEVGAGYVNAAAAVDKVFNRNKGYRNGQEVSYNAVLGTDTIAPQAFHIDFDPSVSGPSSTNAKPFTVEPGVSVLKVRATVDIAGEPGATNLVGLRLHAPDGTVFSPTFALNSTSNVREGIVTDPIAGTWFVEARGTRGTSAAPVTSPQQLAPPGPMDGTVSQIRYILPNIADIAGHTKRSAIETALLMRLVDTYPDGSYRPDSAVTRGDLAVSLQNNTLLRQTLSTLPKFNDVSGDLARYAEAVTAKGSNIKDVDFLSTGMMSFTGTTFNPGGTVNRLDLAVALVKALGRDAEARSLAGSTVTFNGTPITDGADIPASLRGHVQIALNSGLFIAFPSEVRQTAPGQFIVVPGPRFEPSTAVTRATLAETLIKYRQLFTTGG